MIDKGEYLGRIEKIFEGMARELVARGVPADQPLNEMTLPAVRMVLSNATDSAVEVLRDIAVARGDMMNTRHGRRLFLARFEGPARRKVTRALVRAERQLVARKGEAKPVSAFLADAIKEALHAE